MWEDQEEESDQDNGAGPDIERAKGFLGELFRHLELDVTVDVQADGRLLRVQLQGDDAALLLPGKGATARADVLEAIQLVLSRTLYAGEQGRGVVLDAAGFRDERLKLLEPAADRLSRYARDTGLTVRVMGMSAFDRRAIHVRLAETPGVRTDSEGEGFSRTLVIVPEKR